LHNNINNVYVKSKVDLQSTCRPAFNETNEIPSLTGLNLFLARQEFRVPQQSARTIP